MIIAEISQNFTNLEEAEILIDLAVQSGADLVKAQLFDGIKLYGKRVPAELSFDDAKHLFEYGKSIGIEVFFSVFDVEKVHWCKQIGVERYKVACSQNENQELKKAIGFTQKNTIISIENYHCSTYTHWTWGLNSGVKLLYCVPKYPATFSDIDFEDNFDGEFAWADGFSDHTIGLDVAKIALARGARIIEKHFAIDHKTGVDAEWSMMPEELKELKRFENICLKICQ